MRSQRRKKACGGRWASALLLPFLAAILGMAATGSGSAIADGDFVTAWKAYQAAVARKAPAEELLPLAQAVYDALPARPADAKQQRLKAAAAFNLGAALRDLERYGQARDRFRESVELFKQGQGPDAVELVDPLWEWARLERRIAGSGRATLDIVSRLERVLEAQGDRLLSLQLDLHTEWAFALSSDGAWGQARRHIEWLERTGLRLGPRGQVARGDAAFLRGKFEAAEGNHEKALSWFRQARERYLGVLPAGDARPLALAEFMVVSLEELGRSDEATPLCQEIGRHAPPGAPSPRLIYRKRAEIPQRIRQRRMTGAVSVVMTVTPDGRTADIRIVSAEPPGVFEEATLAAVRRFRYAPRFENGRPVATEGVRYLYNFAVANN